MVLTSVSEIIKTLELGRLSNTRNAILYSLPYVLAFGIEKSWDEGFDDNGGRYDCPAGNTIVPRIKLIHFADEEVGKPPSFLGQIPLTDS